MGRESRFDRQANDWYPTDRRAFEHLLPHLLPGTPFVEPCAGDGRLVTWLAEAGHFCFGVGDIAPRIHWVSKRDARGLEAPQTLHSSFPTAHVITNPPYERPLMHELLGTWLGKGWACWLLIDAPWMQTGQARDWLRHCTDIVAAGRMNVFGETTGKKDHCWFRFVPSTPPCPPLFWALGARSQIPVDDATGAAGGGPPPAANLVSGEASRPAAQAESG